MVGWKCILIKQHINNLPPSPKVDVLHHPEHLASNHHTFQQENSDNNESDSGKKNSGSVGTCVYCEHY